MWWSDLVPSTIIHATSECHTISEFSMTSRKYRFNNVYQTRPCIVTDLKLKHTEQDVAFMSLETTRRHIISIELSLLWKANIFLVNEEFLHLLWNQKAHYSVHEHLPIVHILSLINQVHTLLSCFKMNFNTRISFPSTPGSAEQPVSFSSLTNTIHAYSRCASYLFN